MLNISPTERKDTLNILGLDSPLNIADTTTEIKNMKETRLLEIKTTKNLKESN